VSDAHDPVAVELAIRDLVHRYADAVCRMDVDAVAACFVPDGVWTVTGHGEPRGREEIAGFLAGLLGGWSVIVHALLSGRVALGEPGSGTATGRWYISEFGLRSDGTELRFAGVYHDVYAHGPDGWRFGRRRYDSMFRAVGTEVAGSPFPAITDPAITDPAITDPAITDPAITDPA
jgi:ketosteroid isomerase-like protein